jgi:hypothetical protein
MLIREWVIEVVTTSTVPPIRRVGVFLDPISLKSCIVNGRDMRNFTK